MGRFRTRGNTMINNPFKGEILISTTKDFKCPKKLEFNLKPKKPCFLDTLMENFKQLNFSNEEKIKLKQQFREWIWRYQEVGDNSFVKNRDQLIAEIQSHQKKVYIHSEDFGSFLCLGAAFSGDLPDNVVISFHLESLPINLFPKKWIQAPLPKNVNIEVENKINTWLDEFETLTNRPRHFIKEKSLIIRNHVKKRSA